MSVTELLVLMYQKHRPPELAGTPSWSGSFADDSESNGPADAFGQLTRILENIGHPDIDPRLQAVAIVGACSLIAVLGELSDRLPAIEPAANTLGGILALPLMSLWGKPETIGTTDPVSGNGKLSVSSIDGETTGDSGSPSTPSSN